MDFIEESIESVDCDSTKAILKIVLMQREILLNHSKLPKVNRKSKWHALRGRVSVFVTAGLSLSRDSLRASKLRELGFVPEMPVPEKRAIFNPFSMLAAVHGLKPEYQEAGNWLMNHLKIIPFKELCASIKDACAQISEEIRTFKSYSVLNIPGKSQQWMADIACRFLPEDMMPSSIENVTLDKGTFELLERGDVDNLMLFDHVVYLGTQIDRFLRGILNEPFLN